MFVEFDLHLDIILIIEMIRMAAERGKSHPL